MLGEHDMALARGDIAFVGYNGDGTDGFQFVALTAIGAGEVITFTDSTWSGTAFTGNEARYVWTAPAAGIAAGTVITVSGMGAGGIAAGSALSVSGGGTATVEQLGGLSFNPGLAASAEVIYALTGNVNTVSPPASAFIAAIGNNSTNTLATWTTANGGVLTNTGLTPGVDSIGIQNIAPAPGGTGPVTNTDVAIYNGARATQSSFGAYDALINNSANWIGEDGSGDQSANGVAPEASLNPAAFSLASGETQTVGFAAASQSLSQNEGNSGTTNFTFTVQRTGGTTGDLGFSGTFAPGGTTSSDYVGGVTPTGFNGTIPAGQTSVTVTIAVAGDTAPESDEAFSLTLTTTSNAASGVTTQIDAAANAATGTILNDDGQVVDFSAASVNVSHPEGNSGTTDFTFTVQRAGGTTGDVSFSGTITSPGTDGADYQGGTKPTTFNGTIPNGQSLATVTIQMAG